MDRFAVIRNGISKADAGLEIAPWFAPITAKVEGYNVKILDVFDTEELRVRAEADPLIPDANRLEPVDYVGTASDIAALVGGPLDYIVSSHNFEHIPDPIRFLQGVEKVLRPNGLLSMALPDFRFTFDIFRPFSNVSHWLEAYDEGRTRPTERQVFEDRAYKAQAAFEPIPYYRTATLCGRLKDARDSWSADEYRDAHCSIFCPASFELMLKECQSLGLVNLSIESISKTVGIEFFVRLRNTPPADFDIEAERTRLLRKMHKEMRALPPLSIKRRIRKLLRF